MPREPVSNGDAASDVARVSIEGRTIEITRTLGEINFDNLTKEVQEAGGQVVWYGTLAARAYSQQRRRKIQLEIARAEVSKDLRREAARLGEKTTERSIEENVLLNDRVQNVESALIDAEEHAMILTAVQRALEEKQRTLRMIVGTLARELDASGGAESLRETMRQKFRERDDT